MANNDGKVFVLQAEPGRRAIGSAGTLPGDRDGFRPVAGAGGRWPGPVYELIFYAIDNEIHHRGQGYVYLRALGVEPPPFYERG